MRRGESAVAGAGPDTDTRRLRVPISPGESEKRANGEPFPLREPTCRMQDGGRVTTEQAVSLYDASRLTDDGARRRAELLRRESSPGVLTSSLLSRALA